MPTDPADILNTALDSYVDRLDRKRFEHSKPKPGPQSSTQAETVSKDRTEPAGNPAAQAPLDLTGTRRAPRFTIQDNVNVEIDGNTATLVNLSLVGAQVLSATIIRPNQRVRFVFTDERNAARIRGVVASVSVELSKGVPHYRAGIEFLNGDQTAVQRIIDARKRTR
jgi:hypothetical protein